MKTLLFFLFYFFILGCGHTANSPIILIFIVNLPYLIIIFCFYKYFRNKKIINGEISNFWLNENEKETYYTLQTEHDNLEKKVQEDYNQEKKRAEKLFFKYTNLYNDAKKKLESLYDEGIQSNITRNKDGQFSSRSNAGKELNRSIAETMNKITLYSNEASKAKGLFPPEPSFKYSKIDRLNLLKEKPLKKWNNVKKIYCGYKASRAALVFFCIALVSITFPVVFLADSSTGQKLYEACFAPVPSLKDLLLSSPNYFEVLLSYVRFLLVGPAAHTEINFPNPESVPTAFDIPIFISVTTLLVFRISKFFHNKCAEKNMAPKPPQVDLTNYDKY